MIIFEMVQKTSRAAARPRGRPRAYDPETALARATEAFWKSGYAATSLDELAAATGMNRPSLYMAFGDKQALYLQALERYWTRGLERMREMLACDRPLPEALLRVYQAALDIYFPGNGPPRGCFAIGTATTAAVDDPLIRAVFAQGLRKLDEGFAARIRADRESGELPGGRRSGHACGPGLGYAPYSCATCPRGNPARGAGGDGPQGRRQPLQGGSVECLRPIQTRSSMPEARCQILRSPGPALTLGITKTILPIRR